MNLRGLVSLLLLFMPLSAFADGFTRGIYQLFDGPLDNQYEFITEYPVSSDSSQRIIWPKGCHTLKNSQYQAADTITRTYLIQCETPLKSGDAISVPQKLDSAIFELQLGQWQSRSIVSSGQSGSYLILQANTASQRALLNIATEYLLQGVMHIWFGWDHLAFVFCLCLLARGVRPLLWSITAFTIGHSISMALSFFKLVILSIPPVEAIIALSIVLIAREAWLNMDQVNKSGQLRMLVLVVLFGLIHGLGFASALEAIGVAPNERISALIFFNLGVETGQIIFVTTVLTLMLALRRVQQEQNFTRGTLLIVGSVACYWTIERISTFSWAAI